MKWIGQHIYDLISRFRSDVYLEDLSTTTETNVLVVDSDGKVSKSTSVAGDLTEITAGTLIDVTNGTGPNVTVNVDLSEAAAAVMAAGDGIIFTDADDSNIAKQETLQDLLDTIAGTVTTTGLDRSGATLVVSDLHPVGVNGSANQVLTDDGDGTITSESALTFDGVTLKVLSDAEDSNMMEIDANTLTTGSALVVDVDDALTASSVKSLVKIDYDKAGITGASATNNTTGLDINMADAATNHALGAVTMTGIQVDLDSASADGAIAKTGLTLNVGADGVGDAARTVGVEMEVTDGGTDILMTSSDNTTADFCKIATGASGATTITTTDGGGTAADLSLTADGKIVLTPADISGDVFHLDADANANNVVNIDAGILDMDVTGNTQLNTPRLQLTNTTTSSSSEGGKINLICDDGAAMGDDHQLGKLGFYGAEDGSNTTAQGAKIAAFADAAWSGTENGTRLEFHTMDGDASLSKVLTLDSDKLATFTGDMLVTSAVSTKPLVKLLNTTSDAVCSQLRFEKLRADNGVASGTLLGGIAFDGEDNAQNAQQYAFMSSQIDVSTDGEESGKLTLGVANHDGGAGDGLILIGGDVNNEIDVTLGLGAASVVTMPGKILAHNGGMGTRHYGSTIKVLPSDFMINDDAASPLSFKDGSNSGVHVNDTANEVIAFVAIPEGMKATHVDVYGTHNKTLKVWAPRVDQSFDFTGTTLGTGAVNTQLDITDTDATAENYLAIQVTLTATTQRVWGGIVTIAPQ